MTSKFAGRFRQHAFRSPHCVSGTKMRLLPPKGPLSATNKYGNWRPMVPVLHPSDQPHREGPHRADPRYFVDDRARDIKGSTWNFTT
jgi:hypothetical protein